MAHIIWFPPPLNEILTCPSSHWMLQKSIQNKVHFMPSYLPVFWLREHTTARSQRPSAIDIHPPGLDSTLPLHLWFKATVYKSAKPSAEAFFLPLSVPCQTAGGNNKCLSALLCKKAEKKRKIQPIQKAGMSGRGLHIIFLCTQRARWVGFPSTQFPPPTFLSGPRQRST